MLILEIAGGIVLGVLLLAFLEYVLVGAIALLVIGAVVGLLVVLVGPRTKLQDDVGGMLAGFLVFGAFYWLRLIVVRLVRDRKLRLQSSRESKIANEMTFDEIVGRREFAARTDSRGEKTLPSVRREAVHNRR